MIKNILVTTLLLASSISADLIRDDNLDVVNDDTAYLMWQDNSDVRLLAKNWQDAIDYCADLTHANYTNWRLPNFNELYSIVDKDASDPAINSSFVNVASDMFSPNIYWSSTSYSLYTTQAWTIIFSDANNGKISKTNSNYVRCVRDNH